MFCNMFDFLHVIQKILSNRDKKILEIRNLLVNFEVK